jgi:hypothetical protein
VATNTVYGNALDHLADGDLDWTADTIKVMLTTSSYTPDQDAHDFRNDVTDEVSGTGYSAGGVTLANATRTYNAGTNTLKLDGDDVSWVGSFTARYAVIYKARGGASSADELISCIDFGGDQTVSSSTFAINWHANGIFTLNTA